MDKRQLKAYAKFDPAHLFDGLFVPTSGRKRGRLYVPPRDFGGSKISFQGFEELGADDQSVLLAISAQLGVDGLIIEHDTDVAEPIELRNSMALNVNSKEDLVGKKTSLRSIAYDAGYSNDSGRVLQIITRSLNRLRNAQIREITPEGWDRVSNLISVIFNDESGETFVAANPRLTKAVLSGLTGQHVKISLYERNQLKKEASKILHAWLCSNVRLNGKLGINGVNINTLIPHVYGIERTKNMNIDQKSKARLQVRAALKEIKEQTNWNIQTSKNIIFIRRPKEIPLLERLFPHGKDIVSF